MRKHIKTERPHATPEVRAEIVSFLHFKLSQASEAVCKAREAVSQWDAPQSRNQLQYWENVCSGIKWCLHSAQGKRRGHNGDGGST